MDIINKLLICCGFLLILMSCDDEHSTKQKADSDIRFFSDSYKPPFFTSDNRVEKIKEIAPAIQQLIEEYATTRNI